jgi:hypothetical protein
MADKFAFRCKNCGRLHTSEAAAEALHPHACCVCGSGVSFHPQTGIKTVDPENWEVLADCAPERLAELGLIPEQVLRHAPWKSGEKREAQHVTVAVEDGAVTTDSAG